MQILLIEDNSSDASLLTEFITHGHSAPNIEWVADGQEALDYMYQKGKYRYVKEPDVILLDLALPRLGGYEVLKTLKESPFSSIPVIIITTSDNPVDYRSCMDLGATSYYSKPGNLQGYSALAQQLGSEFTRLSASAPESEYATHII